MILRPKPKEGNTRMLSGRFCVLRRGRRHIVLIRPNPLQFGHLGLEIMFGVRLAKRFRAPLYIIRPDQVVNTALYELVVDGVTFNVVEGWRATLLTWIFFSGGALSVKDKPVPYASPIGYLLTYRFLRLNNFVVIGLWHKLGLGPVWRRSQLYMKLALRYQQAVVHIAKRILGTAIHGVEGEVAIRIRPEPTRLNPSYGRRLWVDDVGSFRITPDRLPMLRTKAEGEFNILP